MARDGRCDLRTFPATGQRTTLSIRCSRGSMFVGYTSKTCDHHGPDGHQRSRAAVLVVNAHGWRVSVEQDPTSLTVSFKQLLRAGDEPPLDAIFASKSSPSMVTTGRGRAGPCSKNLRTLPSTCGSSRPILTNADLEPLKRFARHRSQALKSHLFRSCQRGGGRRRRSPGHESHSR